jgi:hypothetical protein
MAGPFQRKGIRSLRRVARAVRSRLEPGETVRWAVYGRASQPSARVVVIATDRTIDVFGVAGRLRLRLGEAVARSPLSSTPVVMTPGSLRIGSAEFALDSLDAQSDARVLVEYVRAVQEGVPVQPADTVDRSIPPMPGAFHMPGPVRSRAFRDALIPAVVSLVVLGSAVLASAVTGRHGGESTPPAPGAACTEVAILDEGAADLSFGDQSAYAGDLGDLLPPALPSGKLPVEEASLGLSAYAAGKYRSDEWESTLRHGGFRRAYVRRWEGSWVEVVEFDSHREALAFHLWANRFSCVYSDSAFAVPQVAGSSGLRILYSSGQVQERVSFVRGSRRYAVSVDTMGPPPDHSEIDDLARLTDRYAS